MQKKCKRYSLDGEYHFIKQLKDKYLREKEIIKITGKVKWFNNQRGVGFISGDNGKEVFVHYSGIVGEGFKELAEDDSVKYDIKETEKGIQAINVVRTSILITDGDDAYKITLLA